MQQNESDGVRKNVIEKKLSVDYRSTWKQSEQHRNEIKHKKDKCLESDITRLLNSWMNINHMKDVRIAAHSGLHQRSGAVEVLLCL